MAAPDAAAYNSMVVESMVNGVWYHVISQLEVFTFPKYIIAPEYRTGGGTLRGDLFVIRIDADPSKNKAVFAFEGKREGTDSEFRDARAQLWGYLKDITKSGTRSYSFGVVAAGTKYAIEQNNGTNLNRRVKPIKLMIEEGLSDNPEYGIISTPGEYNNVSEILRTIEGWIDKNVY